MLGNNQNMFLSISRISQATSRLKVLDAKMKRKFIVPDDFFSRYQSSDLNVSNSGNVCTIKYSNNKRVLSRMYRLYSVYHVFHENIFGYILYFMHVHKGILFF